MPSTVSLSYRPRLRASTRLALDPSRIVIDVGVLLVLGAMSLPFVTAEAFRQRAVSGDGLVALLLVLPVFLMTLLPDQSTPLPTPLAWASAALAAIAIPFTVVKYLDAATLAGTLDGSIGMGARVLVMGAFTVLCGVVLGMIRHMRHLPAPVPAPASVAPAPGGRRARALPPETPAPRTSRAAGRASPPASGVAPSPAAQGRAFPRWRRSPSPQPQSRSRGARRSPTAEPPAREVPPGTRPPTRLPARPRPADPDTEPTLPAQRPVQPWWPEDLDDLFS